jgi:hypothetical protein
MRLGSHFANLSASRCNVSDKICQASANQISNERAAAGIEIYCYNLASETVFATETISSAQKKTIPGNKAIVRLGWLC